MLEQLKLRIRSGHPIIAMETLDELRAVAQVRTAAEQLAIPLVEWSLTTGLVAKNRGTVDKMVPEGKPVPALQYVVESPLRAIWLFKDLGQHLKDPLALRILRDIQNEFSQRESTLVLIDAASLPDSLRRIALPFEIEPPSAAELEQLVKRTFRRIAEDSKKEVTSKVTKQQLEDLVQALRGLNCSEAERVVAEAIHHDNNLDGNDLPRIIEAKRRVLAAAGCLESIEVDRSVDDIGGLDRLKAWLRLRRGGYSEKARAFGIEPPRGILLLGVQGCGKSLCAKVSAAEWNMPLLKLDPGVLYQKFVGESENQLRQALRQAEAMAPVVLWVDEIEKAFASANASSADGGLSQRMFGTLLSWMQEHRHPIFLIATANNIEALPPELMRKGRFDEIFFVDLPKLENRVQILTIHLNRRKRDPGQFSLPSLAQLTDGFSGAELEQVVLAALYRAFSRNEELADRHLQAEIAATQPLSVILREKIAELRAWSFERCVPAN